MDKRILIMAKHMITGKHHMLEANMNYGFIKDIDSHERIGYMVDRDWMKWLINNKWILIASEEV